VPLSIVPLSMEIADGNAEVTYRNSYVTICPRQCRRDGCLRR
jgi:hypothetical protein